MTIDNIKNIDKYNVLPEYPRPQLRRNSYINLNGIWGYAIVKGDTVPQDTDGDIIVPFSPECSLSGVNRRVKPEDTLWYMREFSVPEGFDKGRMLLHFGAVDQMAEVFLNGSPVGSHVGGYTPFTIDITREIRENNQLIVKVKDTTDSSYHSRGKQKTKKGGIWYTPQSGIWQTVWIESVPEEYISGLHIVPRYDDAAVEITAYSNVNRPCTFRMGMVVAHGETNSPMLISMQGFTPWSPEQPHIYDFSIRMGDDAVDSYFGMRKFDMRKDNEGKPRLFVNNRPYFHNGVLDQGYWPDGLYTAPTDEAMINDITAMKELGFNMLRKHIKIEPLRWYYHCDRLGMLVWQDMINGGGSYKFMTVTAPLFTGAKKKDDDYAAFAREDEDGRKQYRHELDDMIAHLFNCVSIAMWVPFNEGWGQFDAAETAAHVREIDPTRLIDHASGWHDQGAGDVCSKHVYFKPYKFKPDGKGRAVVLSEFGGYNLTIAEHSDKGREFGYKRLKTQEELLAAYKKLYEQEVIANIPKGLSAAVYTQLSDVEGETNGLLTYDRAVLKLPADEVKAINSRVRLGEESAQEADTYLKESSEETDTSPEAYVADDQGESVS